MKRNGFMLRAVLLACLCLGPGGCTLFTHYTTQMRPVTDAVRRGDLTNARQVFPEKRLNSTNDRLCYMLEKGTLAEMAGACDESNQIFGEVNQMFEAGDQRAKIAAGKILQGGGALLINDKAMAYEGEPYERIFMHTLGAMNYLALGRKDEARVEIKQAYEQSKRLAEVRQKEIEQSRAYAEKNRINEQGLMGAALGQIFSDATVSRLRRRTFDPYQNAFTSYFSSAVYEMNGDYNDAYIDCALAHEIAPEAQAPARELARLADLSNMPERKKEWEEKFGPAQRRPEGNGEVLVFFQCGLVAHKEQIWFPIPVPVYDSQTGTWTIVTITVSFPRYTATPTQAAGLELGQGGKTLCQTEVLTDMDALASQNFYDRVPAMLIRLAVRASIKAAAAYAARNQAGSAGGVDLSSLLVGAALSTTEQADLRSWLLAPATLQCARLALPAGEQTLDVALKGQGGQTLTVRNLKVPVAAGKFTVVNLRAIDGFVGEPQISKPL